jgi:hypothetical protein
MVTDRRAARRCDDDLCARRLWRRQSDAGHLYRRLKATGAHSPSGGPVTPRNGSPWASATSSSLCGSPLAAEGDASRRDGDSDGYGRSPREHGRLHRGGSTTARGRVPQDSPPKADTGLSARTHHWKDTATAAGLRPCAASNGVGGHAGKRLGSANVQECPPERPPPHPVTDRLFQLYDVLVDVTRKPAPT